MNHGRPLGIRKTIRLMVALTILAWATQTLLSQLGYGAELAQARENFVPAANDRAPRSVTIQLRGEVVVPDGDVKLKQVARWSDRDAAFFTPIADLVVLRLGKDVPFRTVSVPEIKGVLHDAGVNIVGINFVGALTCTVERSDVQVNEGEALRQWMNGNAANPTASALASVALPDEAATVELLPASDAQPQTTVDVSPVRTLRHVLTDDLAQRTGVAADMLQISFNAKDEQVLNLAEPMFKFHVEPQRGRALGSVRWEVVISTGNGDQTVSLSANARAWQEQIVLARPLAAGQVIQAQDVTRRRALTDRIDDQPLLTWEQSIGHQVSRDLKPGTVLTARMIEPVPLVRAGQFVTVTLNQGSVQVKTVGRAMDDGAFGQIVRVKNEATKDIYQVVMTGPQTAEMSVGTAAMGATTGAQ